MVGLTDYFAGFQGCIHIVCHTYNRDQNYCQ